MGADSKIEWTDHTFNPWVGCTKVSPGCDHCYAEAWDRRFAVSGHAMRWGSGKARSRTSAANWRQPVKWDERSRIAFASWQTFRAKSKLTDAELVAQGFIAPRRPKVFCASLADVFDNEVSVQWRINLLKLIESTPFLDWLLLTKRIGNAHAMLETAFRANQYGREGWADNVLPNVWLGASIVNQAEADRDIPKLLQVPAAKRFLSMEPLLGDVRLGSWLQRSPSAAFDDGRVTADMPAWTRIGSTAIDWVIVGGESGPHARPMHPQWARSLRDQCTAAGVAFHFKQWGEWVDVDCGPSDDAAYEGKAGCWVHANGGSHTGELGVDFFGEHPMYRVGKKAAGRLLDGRTWDEVPG